MKKNIIIGLIGLFLGLSISVGASYLYKAKDIEYINVNNSDITNIQDAIEDLYNSSYSMIKTKVYSAANDQVYYYFMNDTTGSKINLCTTNSAGYCEGTVITKGDDIVFYSSIAKDTVSGTNTYTKTIKVDKNTNEIYVMPDNALYWYGNKCEFSVAGGIDDMANMNYKWTGASGELLLSGTFKANSWLSIQQLKYTQLFGLSTKKMIDGSKYHYVKSNMTRSGTAGHVGYSNSLKDVDSFYSGATETINNNIHTLDISNVTEEGYLISWSYNTNYIEVFAMWLE